MTDDTDNTAARFLHLRGQTLSKGEPIAPPLVSASMFHLPGLPEGPGYGRDDNPTVEGLEAGLSHLEGAPALVFPSGMAAIAAALFACLRSGDRLLLPSDGYYTTRLLAEGFLTPFQVTVETRPTQGFATGGFAGFDVIFVETPSNPGLDLVDIAAIVAAASGTGAHVIVDNTTMTPYGQRPLDLGASILVASDTKAPNGHSDLLLGHAASADPALISRMRDWRKLAGGIPGAFECWLAHRGLETLEIRFQRMCVSAGIVARRLADHPAIQAIRYPGLPEDPSHALAQRQMQRFGFLIGLTFASEEMAESVINTCEMLRPATSFGGVHSSAERRARWGDAVAPGFVRLSVGIEPVEPLWAALKSALDSACA